MYGCFFPLVLVEISLFEEITQRRHGVLRKRLHVLVSDKTCFLGSSRGVTIAKFLVATAVLLITSHTNCFGVCTRGFSRVILEFTDGPFTAYKDGLTYREALKPSLVAQTVAILAVSDSSLTPC